MKFSLVEKQLIHRGILSSDEIEALKERAEEEEETLLEYLLRTNRLSTDEHLDIQTTLSGLPVWETISEDYVDEELVKKFPIHYLKRHGIVPLSGAEGKRYVAICDHTALDLMNDISLTLASKNITPVLTTKNAVIATINRVFGASHDDSRVSDVLDDADDAFAGELDDESINDLLDDTSDAPFIKLVNMVLAQAVRAKASDIHIEPYRDALRVRFRLDGVLYDKHTIARRYHAAIVSRIKIMAKLNIAEKRLPQDGRIALALGGRQVDLRVSTLPTSYGERIVLRLLEKDTRILSMNELGLEGDDLSSVKQTVGISHGIILVTGPTGSGKTTTLYAILNHINSPDQNIMTIEDPVEYQLDGVGQMQVNTKIDLTFARGLRTLLRQDPDIVLIGEIRDKETAEIAIQAALTGHLVFSTLHTNDAPSAITRLMDMGVEPFLLSSVLRMVIAQRLVRVLCPVCRTPYIPTDDDLQTIDDCKILLEGQDIFKAGGCPECMRTGYKGRQAAYEIMECTDTLKALINQRADSHTIRTQALQDGMNSLRRDGCRKVLRGITTMAEVLRVSNL